ncbi:hypothetical protein IBHPHPPA_00007 [Salmonella phage KKP 3828]|uniref:Uncharacterized protein n=1 Tax=Salmonella phage KKP 3828 TaxID=3041358 RepID=A0AA50F380_9CAUD|nr:hypothetical protein IBHPHPPA_00007 [Salmonella phage KKP 3828]
MIQTITNPINYSTRSTSRPGEVEHIMVVGKTCYEAGRQYPWFAQHGPSAQYFATQSEAVAFARTGEVQCG